MKQILIAAALALVASTPLALAKTTPPPASILTTEHCTSVEQNLTRDWAHYGSEPAFQAAEEKAMGLCRWNKDRDGKIVFSTSAVGKG